MLEWFTVGFGLATGFSAATLLILFVIGLLEYFGRGPRI